MVVSGLMSIKKVFSVVLLGSSVLAWLLAAIFLGASTYAVYTIPLGHTNDAGFGVFFSITFGIIGLFCFLAYKLLSKKQG